MTSRTDQRGWTTTFGYNDRGLLLTRTTAIKNVLEVSGTRRDKALYSYAFDDNGNPTGQTAAGLDKFGVDDRTFMADSLDRLTQTRYWANNTYETSVVDLVSNRETFTGRTGGQIGYALAALPEGLVNEYGTIGGVTVTYDAAGIFLHLRSGVADDAIAATGVGRAAREPTRFVVGAEVKQFGKTIGVGTIDLKPTLDRINAKRILSVAHDGLESSAVTSLRSAQMFRRRQAAEFIRSCG
jgi:YD repeat-containing protein